LSKLNLEHFASRANEAAFWEAWVGAVLARSGLYTLHHPFTVAKSRLEVGDYSHTYDLDVISWERDYGHQDYIAYPPIEGSVAVEVKSKETFFTSPTDYPYKTVILCSQSSYLRKWPGTAATKRDFLFVSRPTGSILWVPTGSPVTMGNTTFDGKRGELYATVSVPKESLKPIGDFVGYVKTVCG
jgi:hypothetical protein